ncbi:MAG: hypothetical protein ACREJO_08090 [Phycisphaerales bacterium]
MLAERHSPKFIVVAALLALTWVALFAVVLANEVRRSCNWYRSEWSVIIVTERSGRYLATNTPTFWSEKRWPLAPGDSAVIIHLDDRGMRYLGADGLTTLDERDIRTTWMGFDGGGGFTLERDVAAQAAAELVKMLPGDPAVLAEFEKFADGLTPQQLLNEGHTGGTNYSWSGIREQIAGSALYATGYWSPFALVGLTLLWIWRRSPRHGHCGKCGYDLTGLTGDVCPECGGVRV